MSLNPAGTVNYNWNYSNPNNAEYSEELIGTVVSLQEVQAREFNPQTRQPGRPRTWPDGNPVMNIRVGFALADGRLKSITFQKAGKKQVSGEKPSLHMQLFNLTNKNMMELIGKTIHLKTWPANPQTGAAWGQGNPRLFEVTELSNPTPYQLSAPLPDDYKVPELLCDDGAAGGQPMVQPVAPAPAQMAAPVAMPQPYAPQPTMQPMVQQPTMQPAMQPMAQPQPAAQPMTAGMPAGMDPQVANAMQQMGAVNVQPVADPQGEVYGDIPF